MYGRPVLRHVWIVDDIVMASRDFVTGGIVSEAYPSIWSKKHRHHPSQLLLIPSHEYSIAINIKDPAGSHVAGFTGLSAKFDVGGVVVTKTFQLSAFECGQPHMTAARCSDLAAAERDIHPGKWESIP